MSGPLPAVVGVADGRRVLIREVDASDAEPLAALYGRLSGEDRYRRFFCGYKPPYEFFEQLARPALGEARVVAEPVDGDPKFVVGEAGYVGLPNGNGELGMAVDAGWRGGLGSYLLDRLRLVAADRHVPNLEADVLVTNGPMLGVLRARGAVVIGHDGWDVLRLMIGTRGDPTWSGDSAAPKVLVETAAGRWPGEDDQRLAGARVITCHGPTPSHRCPALEGRPCPLVDGADVVVVGDAASVDRWQPIIDANRRLSPGVPVLIDRRQPTQGDAVVDQLLATLEQSSSKGTNGPDAAASAGATMRRDNERKGAS